MATVQGYNSVVGKTAAVSTPSVSTAATASITKPLDFRTLNKGINDVVSTINAVREEEDKQAIVAAMDNYNSSMNDLLSGEKGLLNTKMEEADGIADRFNEQQAKARQAVLGNTKLHFAANTAALDHYLASQTNAAMNKVRAHQAQQKQLVTDTHFNNLNASNIDKAIAAYNDIGQLEDLAANQKMLTNLTYGSRGADFEESTNRKAVGAMVGGALQTAIANNDFVAAQNIVDKLGSYLPANQKMQYEKLSYAKQENIWMQDMVKKITAGGGDLSAKLAAVDNIMSRDVVGFEGGRASLVDIVRKDRKDDPYYLNAENSKAAFGQSLEGTSCVATMGFGPLKNTPYKGCYNVDDAIAIAKKNNQLIDGGAGYKPQAGDLAVVNNGNHIVMVTETGGTIQNGESGNNGKGGVYEKEMSPEQMFGKVDYYIRTSDYNQSTTGNRSVEVSPEQREKLKNLIISEHNKGIQLRNISNNDYRMNMEQVLFEQQKAGMSADDARAQYVNKQNFDSQDQYEMAELAFKKVYGAVGGAGSTNSTRGSKVDSGVSTQTVYQVTKLIEQGQFSGEGGAMKLQRYLDYCADRGELSLKDMTKLNELYDDYLQGKGAFKLNWKYLDAQLLKMAGLKSTSPADERERALADGHAAILQFMKKDWKSTIPGQTMPTDEEIMAAIGPKFKKDTLFTYLDPNAGLFESSKKKFDVPLATLNRYGITSVKDVNEFQVQITNANGVTQTIPKHELMQKFGLIKQQ